MAYQVLARKYRPQRFADVVGQDHVTRTLANALEQSRIAHGYIFSGHRGIGKTTIARILAMALNCQHTIGSVERPTFEPCLACSSCEEIRAGNSVDVIEIDAATNRGIDEIRELRDAARYRPARDRYKIYILDEAHQITDAAFNALLKTLEEPPDHVIFMMATTEPENILQTIRSRCQHFTFHAVKFDAILEQLRAIATEENVAAEEEALALLAEAGDGSMRDALSIMDQAIASAPLRDGRPELTAEPVRALMGALPNAVFARLLESVAEANASAVLTELDRLLGAGNSASQIARQFVRYLRNVLMSKIGGAETELLQISPDEKARAAATAMLFGEDELLRFLQGMLRTFDELNYRQEQRFHLEVGVLKLVHLGRLVPLEELMGQLGGAGGGSTPRPTAAAGRTGSAGSGGSPAGSSMPKAAPVGSANDPSRPASPFEQDSQRKAAPASLASATSAVSATKTASPGTSPRSAARPAPADDWMSSAVAIAEPSIRVAPAASASTAAAPAASAPSARTQEKEEHASAAIEPRESAVVAEAKPVAAPRSAADGQAISPPNAEVSHISAPIISDAEPSASTPSASVEASGEEATLATGDSQQADRFPAQATVQPATTPQRQTGLQVDPQADPEVQASSPRLDAIREAACAALEAAGHATAAALLDAGAWTETDAAIRVEVGAKKVMLGLTMNAEAEKIVRAAVAPLANGKKVEWIPSESGTQAQRAPSRPAAAGSVQAVALEHPLVQQAQKLFRAEVRSVVDLRPKR